MFFTGAYAALQVGPYALNIAGKKTFEKKKSLFPNVCEVVLTVYEGAQDASQYFLNGFSKHVLCKNQKCSFGQTTQHEGEGESDGEDVMEDDNIFSILATLGEC